MMEFYLFIAAIFFWILYYYFEGTHDWCIRIRNEANEKKNLAMIVSMKIKKRIC